MTPAPASALAPEAGVVAFFVVGLLGGAHCLGMCGPLVTLYADRTPDRSRRFELRQHALFNAGRTASYALVGAALGLAGSTAFDAAALTPAGDLLRAAVGVAVGLAILAVGAGYLGRGTAVRLPSPPLVGGSFRRVHGAITTRVERWAGGPQIAGLGALHGLLPCPLLYPAFLYAFALGSPLWGGLSLLALGLGTFPTLFLYGAAVGSLGADRRRRLHRALGAAFLALGTIPLLKGLVLLGVPVWNPPLPMPAAPG